MEKALRIFRALLIAEALLAAIGFIGGYLIECGDPCSPYSFLNPIGYTSPSDALGVCIDICVRKPLPFFFGAVDALVITAIVYLIYRQLRRPPAAS